MEEERKEREEWVIIRRQEPRQMKQGSRKSSKEDMACKHNEGSRSRRSEIHSDVVILHDM